MGGRRQALIVATDQYKDPGLGRLRAPARDADTLARVLGDPAIGGFEVEFVANQPEWRLRRTIGALFADRSREDLLLLYLLCHGVTDDSGQLYFATTDTELTNLDATAVPADFVNRHMTRSQSRRIVLLLDCCYSGAFARGMMARAGTGVELRERFEGRGRIVLTASSAMEYAFEVTELARDGGRPSVFTQALVRGLETGEADRDGDGRVSLDELYEYVYEQVRAATPNQWPRRWNFEVAGDLWIARSPSVRPVPLPPELQQAGQHPIAPVRLAAVEELKQLLRGDHAGLAVAARTTLERLTDDDSRMVAAAAKAVLAGTPPPVRESAPPRVQPVPLPQPAPRRESGSSTPASPTRRGAGDARSRRWPRVRLPWPGRRRQVTRPLPRPWTPEPPEDWPEPTDRGADSVATDEAPIGEAESAGGYGFCPNCGHAVKPDTHFCGVCGEYLAWDESPRAASEPPVTPTPSPDERAVFTIAYPNAVSPTIWYSLHVYLHRSRLQAVVDKRIVDQFRRLGLRRSTSTAETLVPLLHGTVVHVKPQVNGLAFNPLVQEVEWWEDLHEVLFRFRALNTAAVPLLGSVDIYAGPLLIAQVPIAVSVGGIGQPEQSEFVEEGAGIFSRIFASYSHQDSDIVSACAEAYRALGIEMLIDRDSLRSGQDWRIALQQLIEDADAFQLFWSTASSVSPHVAQEWHHALQLRDRKGGHFIRPLCWKNPWPTAPDELSNLHFALLDLRELSRVAGRSLGPGSADTPQP
jgi:TIR domain/Caspase domain